MIDRDLRRRPSCPKLKSYWHFRDCRYSKKHYRCAEPAHLPQCPLPRHWLRNGGLNQTVFSLYLFIRDVAGDRAPTAQDLPRTWEEIAPGHLVIARETFECGWWEAVVIERSGDLLTLKHRDYPSIPNFVRHRSAVALISAPAP